MSEGKLLKGFAVTDHKFQGVTTLNQIEDYGLIRPTHAASATKSAEPRVRLASELHKEHQRRWIKARKIRAQNYADYIFSVEANNNIGGTPAITLFHEVQCEHDNTEAGILIPYNSALVAIDGETQTEARYILRENQPKTGGFPIAVTLYHGISGDSARQILHDYNALCHPVTEVQTAQFNSSGQLSIAINKGRIEAGVHDNEINRDGAKSTKKTIVANKQLLSCAAGYQLSDNATQRTVTTKDLLKMNAGSSKSVPPTFSNHLSEILTQCRTSEIIGKAPNMVWQIAGVLLSKNRQPKSLDWVKAVTVYEQTRKTSKKECLIAIEKSM